VASGRGVHQDQWVANVMMYFAPIPLQLPGHHLLADRRWSRRHWVPPLSQTARSP
jgi:hypothetical protein